MFKNLKPASALAGVGTADNAASESLAPFSCGDVFIGATQLNKPDERFVYGGNWFSGQVIKLDLGSGESVVSTDVAGKCMAGMAVFR